MKRGQLTYYFKHKEDILLAVFDRVLQLMYERLGRPPGADGEDCPKSGWQVTKYLLDRLLTHPPVSPEFHCLQYTFLSQIGYREDFRRRLATLYDQWRSHMAEGLAHDLAGRPRRRAASPRALATLIQALLHGLAMQAAADPGAFDGGEMLELCLDVLGSYLGLPTSGAAAKRGRAKPSAAARAKSNGTNGARLAAKG
jgi:AcrR family transcriptional regulator